METKGISCKIPLDLHNRVSEEIRETDSSMSKFIEMVIREHYEKGAEKIMEKGKTLAFQVSEEFFQRIKDYLARYERIYGKKLTQKEFCIEVIREALELGEEELEAYQSEEEAQPVEENQEALENNQPNGSMESLTQEETSDTSGEPGSPEDAEGEEASDEEPGEEPYGFYQDEDIDEEGEDSETEGIPEEEEAASTF